MSGFFSKAKETMTYGLDKVQQSETFNKAAAVAKDSMDKMQEKHPSVGVQLDKLDNTLEAYTGKRLNLTASKPGEKPAADTQAAPPLPPAPTATPPAATAAPSAPPAEAKATPAEVKAAAVATPPTEEEKPAPEAAAAAAAAQPAPESTLYPTLPPEGAAAPPPALPSVPSVPAALPEEDSDFDDLAARFQKMKGESNTAQNP